MGGPKTQGVEGHFGSRQLQAVLSLAPRPLAKTPAPTSYSSARESVSNESNILAPTQGFTQNLLGNDFQGHGGTMDWISPYPFPHC